MDSLARIERSIRNIPDFPRPGIQFKDITPVLADPDLFNLVLELLSGPFLNQGVTKIVAIEARGFILGGALAARFGAGFVPVRKKGKLPYQALAESYDLEYGSDSVEMHVDGIGKNDRVLIHDDVIATGGTAAASRALVQRAGGTVVGFTFLIELGFLNGRARLGDDNVHAVVRY
ncbi:MAG TPA: adenine phosphoribosyltransferase [Rhodothermales bacterium]